MKLLTIVGARPQFIKASAVTRVIANSNVEESEGINEILVHTGQHFDTNMSEIFFTELGLAKPHYNLGVSQCGHGEMTGLMLSAIEKTLLKEKPNMVLVYGDTNSTLAGALAATKLNIPVAHVEAGLRSYNRRMPEEINRVVTDHVSSLLFCPTSTAVENLKKEGIKANVYKVGDVMYDVTLLNTDLSREKINLSKWNVATDGYVLCTVHRAENTDDPGRFKSIMAALEEIAQDIKVVFPVHPRTRKIMEQDTYLSPVKNIMLAEPVSYLEMLALEAGAKAILTDSGGVQKEAYFQGKPCITLRDETEWTETVEAGVNFLCGASTKSILNTYKNLKTLTGENRKQLYGDGFSAHAIVRTIWNYYKQGN